MEFFLFDFFLSQIILEHSASRMATPKKKDKLKLDDVAEKVTHPWQAWFHVTKQRKFYTNVETKVSVWEHPLEKQPKAEKVEVSSFRKQREGKEPAGEPMVRESLQETC